MGVFLLEIKIATVKECKEITELFESLIIEICEKTNTLPNLPPTSQSFQLCENLLKNETYKVFTAVTNNQIVGFLSLCSSYALYAGGEFGIIQEFFVSPAFRSNKVGSKLLHKANEYGRNIGWKRLEVTTPPLPQFDKSFIFYKNNGFEDSEGRRMKLIIE